MYQEKYLKYKNKYLSEKNNVTAYNHVGGVKYDLDGGTQQDDIDKAKHFAAELEQNRKLLKNKLYNINTGISSIVNTNDKNIIEYNNHSIQYKQNSLCLIPDIEGDFKFFIKQMLLSKKFTCNSVKNPNISFNKMKIETIDEILQYWCEHSNYYELLDNIKLENNTTFVFLGDVCDLSDGTIRVLYLLLLLKTKYNDRVFWIVGNRDINKIRLLDEYNSIDFTPTNKNLIYWDNTTINGIHTEICKDILTKYDRLSSQNVIEILKPIIFKGLLTKTFGAGSDPKYRKDEFEKLLNVDLTEIDIIYSYLYMFGINNAKLQNEISFFKSIFLYYLKLGYLSIQYNDCLLNIIVSHWVAGQHALVLYVRFVSSNTI